MDDFQQAPKNNSRLIVLLVIVTALSILASGYLFYQNQLLQKQITQLSTQPSPAPESIIDPIADWKTYTNKDLGISFKMPKNWEIINYGNSIMSVNKIDRDDLLALLVQKSTSSQTIKSYNNKDFDKSSENAPTTISSNKIKIDELDADYNEEISVDTTHRLSVYTHRGKDSYSITLLPCFKKCNKITRELFDQILSTFQFLD